MILPIRENFNEPFSQKQKLFSNAQDMGYFRNIKFLEHWIRAGNLRAADTVNEIESAIDFLTNFIEAVESVHPGKWDIYPVITGFSRFKLAAIIHYDEFIITNTREIEHTIKDMIVKLTFCFSETDKYVIGAIDGGRITVSAFENAYPYQHSHLSTSERTKTPTMEAMQAEAIFHDFCTNGNEMEIHRDEMSTSPFLIEKEELELFLYTLDSFLKWESLEGTPYRRIENLRKETGQGRNVTHVDLGTFGMESHFTRNPEKFELIYAEGTYKVKVTNEFKKECKDVLLDLGDSTYDALVMKEGLDLMSLPKNVNTQISETITYKNDDGVPFHLKIQGTQYNFAILKNSFEFKNQQIDINKYFVHPKLLENVCKRIESNLFSKNAQREFIEAKIKSNNARTLSRESEVSMHSHI